MNFLPKILIAIATVYLLILFTSRYPFIFPGCIFHKLTGYYCPLCGSQRALSSLLQGNVYQAVNYNVLFIASVPLFFYWGILISINAFRRKKVAPHFPFKLSIMIILFTIVIVFWIARNVPFYPFILLAPHEIQ